MASRTGSPASSSRACIVPVPAKGDTVRRLQDHQAPRRGYLRALGAFHLTLGEDGTVAAIRIAYGGMAATPKRATAVEAALIGKPWTEATVEAAMAAFDSDFQPLTDMRAIAEYRLLAAKNLLLRFFSRPAARRRRSRYAAARGGVHEQARSQPQGRRRSPAASHTDQRHDSAHKHVARHGRSISTTCRSPPARCMAALGLSDRAHAEIAAIDLSAVRAAPGVVGVLTAKDVPGENDISPTGRHDEPVLADGKVQFYGQPIFCRDRRDPRAARRAARLAKIEYDDLPHRHRYRRRSLPAGQAGHEPLTLERGDAAAAIDSAPRRLKGQMRIGGQEHFYLEGQIALAIPGEDDEVTV